jgi:hypothetical protein
VIAQGFADADVMDFIHVVADTSDAVARIKSAFA